MFRRIKILTLLQMSDKYKFKKIENVKKFIASIMLRILTILIVMGICLGLLYLLTDVVYLPRGMNLLIFILFFVQLLSIISCSYGLIKSLYLSKDNAILLAYPAKHIEVYLSKLVVFYIYEFIKGLFFTLPLLLAIGINGGIINFVYIISVIIMTILLPLFPVLIGALITIPLVFINRLINRFGWIKIIITVAFAVLLFIGVDYLVNIIPTPLRIVALYTTFVNKVKDFIASVNSYALYCNYIGQIFYGERVLINYLIILGIVIGLVGIVMITSMPLYFRMASHSSEHSSTKKHKGTNKAHTNTFFTFVRKEWLLSIRSIGDFVNNYIFIFALPYILYLMTNIYMKVDRNLLGDKMVVAFVALIALLMLSASNTASSVAITTEGTEFTILKTAPGKTSNMAWAKILFNCIFSTIMLLVSFLILEIRTSINSGDLWMVFFCVELINMGLIMWSLQIDIMHPHLSEYSRNHNIDNIKNIGRSILIGFIVSVLFCGLTLVFLMDDDHLWWSYFRVIAMAVVFFLARSYLFTNFLKAYFADIEF